MLPRGEVLRGGDLVLASDGRVIEVLAQPEKLLHIESAQLAQVAYHLGNRHVPVQVGEGLPAHRGGPRAGGDGEEAGRQGVEHRGAVRARGGRLRRQAVTATITIT